MSVKQETHDAACRKIEELARDLAAETEIVNRIWAIYGSPSYEELQGRSIYDLINADRAALAAANALVDAVSDALDYLKGLTPQQYADLRKDAERLDWIAENAYSLRSAKDGTKNCATWHTPPVGMTRAAFCRLAIDAAIAAKEKP